jgi:histidinol-phosphate/aromatic aminotransferase/cobyric acid decarboxylase-like protein
VAAVNALQEPAYYQRRWDETHALRRQLAGSLTELGFAVTPGVANFLLCHLPEGPLSVAELVRRCRERNLFLRDVTNMGVNSRAVRIAVKDDATLRRMLEIIAEVVAARPAACAV